MPQKMLEIELKGYTIKAEEDGGAPPWHRKVQRMDDLLDSLIQGSR